MKQTFRRGFLYSHVAEDIRRRISDGEYRPGTSIPSEAALVSAFGVSAITVRRALMQLMYEGLLYGRQGLGVFVADTRRVVRVLNGNAAVSMGEDIRRAGLTPGIRELSLERMQADASLARLFRLKPDAHIYRHRKLVLADDEPVSLDTVDMPTHLADRLRERLGAEFLFPLLASVGISISHSHLRFEGMAASDEQSAIFNVAARFPLITAHYVLFGHDGKPIASGNTVSRSDRMVFEVETLPDRSAAVKRLSDAAPELAPLLDSANSRRSSRER